MLSGVENKVARRIIDPLDSEVGVDVEVVSDLLIRHVVHSEEVVGIVTDLHIFLCEIRNRFLIKKFLVRR